MPVYRLASLHGWRAQGMQGLTHRVVEPHIEMPVPAPAFGVPPCEQGTSHYAAFEVWRWTIDRAVVHGPFGIVTRGDWVLEDSLVHVPFGAAMYRRGNGVVELPDSPVRHRLGLGLQAASGNFDNYYHFVLDVLPKLRVAPLADGPFDGEVLLPPVVAPFQGEMALLLDRLGVAWRCLGLGEAAEVERLVFVPNVTGAGSQPHPSLAGFFDRLADNIAKPVLPPRKIYVSRAGAANRRLRNEAAVEALASRHGYDVMRTESLPVALQIAAFRSATHVLAPHGAGLANLVFARPGTAICEMTAASYRNRCFRLIAAMRSLPYGCLIGATTPQSRDGPEHGVEWDVDVRAVASVLLQMG
jgi:capsular polysaccharide biosynthesis protein